MGTENRKRLPFSLYSLSRVMLPPSFSAITLVMDSPNPIPGINILPLANISNIFSSIPSGIPIPVSVTEKTMNLPSCDISYDNSIRP